jgi:hypothetical protein
MDDTKLDEERMIYPFENISNPTEILLDNIITPYNSRLHTAIQSLQTKNIVKNYTTIQSAYRPDPATVKEKYISQWGNINRTDATIVDEEETAEDEIIKVDDNTALEEIEEIVNNSSPLQIDSYDPIVLESPKNTYQGRIGYVSSDEVSDIILQGGNFCQLLHDKFMESLCHDKEVGKAPIVLNGVIGSGNQSTVYWAGPIEEENSHLQVIVKRCYFDTVCIGVDYKETSYHHLSKMLDINLEDLIRFNHTKGKINVNKPLDKGTLVRIPKGGYLSIIDTYKHSAKSGRFNYICDNAFLSESIIASLLKKEKSSHLMHANGFIIREDSGYLFMAKARCTLADCFGGAESIMEDMKNMNVVRDDQNPFYRRDILRSLMFQIFVAIHDLQRTIRCIHYDMILDNIFIDLLSRRHRRSRSQKVYTINNIEYRIPYDENYFNVKIGDFGFACAFPNGGMICRKDVMDGNYESWNMTSEYQRGFDVLFFVGCMIHHFYKSKSFPEQVPQIEQRKRIKKTIELVTRVIGRKLGLITGIEDQMEWINYFIEEVYITISMRPKKPHTFNIGPEDMFDIFEDYKQ